MPIKNARASHPIRCKCKGALKAVRFNVYAKFRARNRAASFNPALLHYTPHYFCSARGAWLHQKSCQGF
jgi:hypothetical protein